MDEYNRVIETNVLNAELNIDEETLFKSDVLKNYIDDNGNHYLVGDTISVIIKKDDWNTFIQNIRTIHYKQSILGDKTPIIEELDVMDFNRPMLYQMAYKHQANGYTDYTNKFLDVRHLQSKMKWGVLPISSYSKR